MNKKILLNIEDKILKETLQNFLGEFYDITEDEIYDICITDKQTNIPTDLYISDIIRLGELLDSIESKIASKTEDIILHEIRISDFEILAKMKLLKYKEAQIQLTEKETDMILYFYSKKNEYISKTELLKNVWGYNTEINTRTIETHIYRLRKKISQISDGKELIITSDKGYKIML